MRIFLLVLFPDFHVVVILFIALSSCVEFYYYYFFFLGGGGVIEVAFLIPPHSLVTHNETNQAKCNKSSNEQTQTN